MADAAALLLSILPVHLLSSRLAFEHVLLEPFVFLLRVGIADQRVFPLCAQYEVVA